jgi:hypothetical protein
MFRSLTLGTVLGCSALGLACANDPTSSQPVPTSALTPQTAQSPGGPGAFIVRYQDIAGFAFLSEDPALTVLTGLTAEQLALACSGGEPVFELGDGRQVFLPDDGGAHGGFKARDLTVMVFEGIFPDFCSVQPVAVGTGDYTSTDGSAFVSRVSFVESTFHARVVEATGEQHHILARVHLIVDPSTGETRKSDVDFSYN